MATGYSIRKSISNGRYTISISVDVPVLTITQILNFRVYSATFADWQIIQDPYIQNSSYIFEVGRNALNKRANFEFSFDMLEMSNLRSITVGFCDEMVRWYTDTFVKIDIDQIVIASQPVPSNKKVCFLSTWNIKCGISQYCKNVADALISKNFEVKAFENTEDYTNVFSFIKSNGYNIFIVQYEPAIIANFDLLVSNIVALKKYNRKAKVYFTIHSENTDLIKLDGIIDGFIYHKKNTLLYRKTRVHLIPMGVPIFDPKISKLAYRAQYGIKEDALVISTVGFMFGWKQHASVLEKLATYMKDNPRLVIQLLTSFHSINNEECLAEYDKIRYVFTRYGIESQVVHITDYISQQELNERLYLSDLGFLWAAIQTTSSSASLKEFVASRLPVIRTDSTHYHDVTGGCMITAQDLDQFASTIIDTISNSKKLQALSLKMENNYRTMNYGNVILKFIEVFGA